MPTPWARSLNKHIPGIYVGTLCYFLPRYMHFLRNIQTQGSLRLKIVQGLAENN